MTFTMTFTMRKHFEIAAAGLTSILSHPLRSAVTIACLLAALTPYVVATGLSQGIHRDARQSIDLNADLYVGGQVFGRPASIPLAWKSIVAQTDGVENVTARIVGAMTIGKEHVPAVLVGLPLSRLRDRVTCIDGRLFHPNAGREVVIGSQLAHRLNLKAGDRIPPFYHSSRGDLVTHVVGVFRADVSLWEANLIFTSFETASAIFDQRGLATDLLVECRPGYEAALREKLLRSLSPLRIAAKGGSDARRVSPEVITRGQLTGATQQGLLHRDGVFNIHYVLALVVAILALLVTSGVGLSERRREIGILKATGWQTDEVLLRGMCESVLLCLLGASLAILLAYVWLEWFNGFWIVGVYISSAPLVPRFEAPFELAPLPSLLGFILSLAIVASGTLYSSWRAAMATPRSAIG
jgi:ABC-type lipoprotein release transport system permease subunit